MYSIKEHLEKSNKVIEANQRKIRKYHKFVYISSKLRLKKLTNYFAEKGLKIAIPTFNLCVRNADLLAYCLAHDEIKFKEDL